MITDVAFFAVLIRLRAIVKMLGKGLNVLPTFVRSIVMAIDSSINRFPFPVKTVPGFQA